LSVKLISYSQPEREFGKVSLPLDLVAYCAKVSNPANQDKMDTAPKLIKYLIDNNHWSPFEMVSVCMEITTTRDIARQILRHRSFSFQEFSQRYADPAALGEQYVPREARLQDNKNRQNSIETEDEQLKARWLIEQQRVYNMSMEAYTWAVSNGIAKEQARAVLPEGNTKSRLYMNGTLRSWIHFVQLRSANGTQKEHQKIAVDAGWIINDLYGINIFNLDS
jgi:thymidylate synthase (FAD)